MLASMALRVLRISTAATLRPSTNDGITSDSSAARGSTSGLI
jgi:hypothetical protein